MKKIFFFFCIGAIVIIYSACSANKAGKARSGNLFFPVIVEEKFHAPGKHPVHIDSAFIDKNILNLKINYSGGCKAHYFQLLTNGTYAKSIPPQLNVFLNDTVITDACRQYKEEIIKFDVSQLKHISQKAVVFKFGNGVDLTYSY